MDSSGNILWNSTSAIQDGKTSAINVARSVVKTSDGGHAAVGALNSTVWLVKFAPESTALPDETSSPPDYIPYLSPTGWLVTIIVVVAVVGVGLLLYFIRPRKNENNSLRTVYYRAS